MGWGASTWLALVPELGYGVYNVANTGIFYPSLYNSNAFTVRKVPQRQVIRTADGGNRRKLVTSGRKVFAGALNTLLHPDQCASWATAIQPVGQILATGTATLSGATVGSATVNSPGSGYPFTTAIPVSFIGGGGSGAYGTVTSTGTGTITGAITITAPGSGYTGVPGVQIGGMPSYTALFWDTVQFWEITGLCFSTATITASATQDYTTLSLGCIAQERGAISTPTWPAESVFSTLIPYQYFETAGNVKLATVAITNYRTMSVSLTNVLKPTWDESQYITSLVYSGRDLNFSLGPQFNATAYRTDFEAQTPLTWILNFTRTSPAHSFTITCETNSYVANIADDLPLDGPAYQTLSCEVFYDPANTTDFAITAS